VKAHWGLHAKPSFRHSSGFVTNSGSGRRSLLANSPFPAPVSEGSRADRADRGQTSEVRSHHPKISCRGKPSRRASDTRWMVKSIDT